MPIQVAYESDLDVVIGLMRSVAEQHPRTLKTSAVDVFVKGFGESGIDMMLSFWVADPEEGSAALQSELYQKMWKLFKQHGIGIPYPQREIRVLNTTASSPDTTPNNNK